MRLYAKNFDMGKVRTVLFHMPDGETYAVDTDSFEQMLDVSYGEYCDTSDVNGIIHFFPKGNA